MKNWKDISQDFKDSAFGKIPRSWFVKTLLETVGNDKSSIVAGPFGSNLKVSDYRNEGVPIIRLQNIERNQFVVKDIQFISPKKAEELAYHSFQGGDIVLAKLGDPVGKTCIVPDQFQHGIVVSDVVRIRVDESRVNKSFLTFLLNSDAVVKQLNSDIIGTTRPRLNLDQIRNIFLPLPPKDDQDKIAAILEITDLSIEQTEQIIAKYQRIKTGLMQDLLTRGIDEQGNIRSEETHEFKDSPLGRIPKEWEMVKLSDIAQVDRGKFGHRPRNDPRFYGGEFPFIQTGDVATCRGEVLNSYSQTLNEAGIAISKKFKKGTIVVTIAANIGDTAILGQDMYLPDSIVGVIVNEKYSARFIELCLQKAKNNLESTAPQSAQKNINLEVLRPLLIPLPDSSEQYRIEKTYNACLKRLSKEVEHLKKLQKIKTGLMQDLLTGKVRVNYKD